nr:DUF6520 family protein [Pedobacter panaciterrae]
MNLRNFLMMAVFLLAVGTSFAMKANSKRAPYFSANIGTATDPICYYYWDTTPCETFYTGPQCTVSFSGVLKPMYERPIPAGPSCVTPLRQYQP